MDVYPGTFGHLGVFDKILILLGLDALRHNGHLTPLKA